MPILLLLFILIPMVEIGVFIQVGGLLGLVPTIVVIFVTAIIGVNLLKQQGVRAWQEINQSMALGKVPALEMTAGAQLLFAGGLLLTPGFVTDLIGFVLMIPQARILFAGLLLRRWAAKANMQANAQGRAQSHSQFYSSSFTSSTSNKPWDQQTSEKTGGRIIEGEVEPLDDNKKT